MTAKVIPALITSDDVFDMIETIASTSSKNEKEALIRANLNSSIFELALIATLDPFTTFGIKKRPPVDCNGSGLFSRDTWGILDSLKMRELTGNEAILTVKLEMERLTQKSAELFWRIISKDLRAGFSESTVNKAKKGLIPTFPYMRCSLIKDAKLEEWPWDDGVISQEKADGMFANIDNEESGIVNISSRQGSQFPSEKFPDIVREMQNGMVKGMQYHGEMVVFRDENLCERQDGNGVLNSVLNGGDFAENERPVYLVWDAIPLSEVKPKGKYTVGYKERLGNIHHNLSRQPLLSIGLIPTRIVNSLEGAMAHCGELLEQGKEGTIIKHPKAIWKDGKSKEQVKLKLEVDVDLKVIAIQPGRQGTRVEGRAGALTCETSDGLLRVDVTVKNEAMRDHVDANPDEWLNSIIAVRANQLLKPSESNPLHSLFLPRMVEANYRTDKSIADSLEEVVAQFESAIKG